VSSELGIGYDPERHAGYVDHWVQMVQILTEMPKEILFAVADAERISDYILTIEQKKEIQHTQEVGVMRQDIPHSERTYLVVPYAERHEARALGARWEAVKKRLVRRTGSRPRKSLNGNRNINLHRRWIHGRIRRGAARGRSRCRRRAADHERRGAADRRRER
jgi:hypothetical protein